MLTPEPELEPEQLPAAVGFGDAAGLWSAAAGLQSFPTAESAVASAPAVLHRSTADGLPPLREMVTVLVFTSAVRSDPSLCLLATTVGSFQHCTGLQGCRVVFVCDGWQSTPTAVDHQGIRRHCPGKRLVELERAKLYAERITALQDAILRSFHGADEGDEPQWAAAHWEILRLPHWHCYGGALRVGLSLVSTPLMLVVQHDFAFVSHIDLRPVASTMLAHSCLAAEASDSTNHVSPSVALRTSHDETLPTLNYCGLLKKAQLHYAMSVRSRSALDIGAPVSVGVPGHSALVLDRLPQLYDSTHLAGAHRTPTKH
jgi:hypothetical protein